MNEPGDNFRARPVAGHPQPAIIPPGASWPGRALRYY